MKLHTFGSEKSRWRMLSFGALLLAVNPSWAQQAAPASAQAAGVGSERPATSKAAPLDEKVVELSPFQVSTSKDRGYFASSSMSGTRLNSKLEDLAASISVVTKQQLLDTASTNINDVFRYEASTEGIYQFTSFGLDRGVISDNVSNDPQGATRIRGLTSANIASNGFGTTLPIDTYNVDSIEISRGPNSSIFGLGNTGGGVNIILARASLDREISTFKTQVDSFDGYRGNFDLNRSLIKGKLALRVLGLYDEKGYERKPSEDTTRRLNALVTVHPFQNTTIRAGFESYRNQNNRPNSSTPRDMVTDWVASGSPTWDPITQTVHFRNGAPAITGVTTALEATLLPAGITPTDSALTTFPSQYIDHGQVQLYMINRMPNATPNANQTGNGPNNTSGTGRLLQNGNFYTKFSATYPLFTPAGISDQSLYDWTSVNLAAPNWSSLKGETTTVDLEQVFFRTERQTLALQASWIYERTGTNSRSFLGNGTNTQVFVDINEKLLDGTVNPYFLRPYIGGSQPIYRKGRNNTENYRGTLAYQLDLTKEAGWLRWLGLHNFSGYGEYRSIYGGTLGFKDTMSSNEAWMDPTAATFSRNGASYRVYPHYYVGDASGGNVDYAPQGLATINAPQTLRYYNGVTGQWINEPVDFSEYYYANRLNKRLLSTYGGNWQGFLLNGRIVPNFGARHDYNRTRDGNSAINPSAATNGFYDQSKMQGFGDNDWVEGDGNTTNAGVVVKAFDWLHFTYSQSNSFSPGSLAYNIYGKALPDPKGKTKDYGLSFELFPDASGQARLNITAKQYETTDFGRGTSEINTIVQRAIRLDADGNGTGGDPDLESFYTIELGKLHPSWTPVELDAETTKLMGVDPNFIDSHRNKTHGDSGDAVSRGKEVEITYNPNRFWTLKGTVVQARALNSTMSPELQQYVADRLPVWMAAKSPFDNSPYWNGSYIVGARTPESWYLVNLLAPMKLAIASEGKPRSQTREWRVNMLTNYKLAGLTDNRWLKELDVGGAVRWEDKAAIGFFGGAPDADGVVRQLDASRPIYDKARCYVDFMAGYNLKLAKDKVRVRLQLNISNVFEGGRLQPVAANPDGKAFAYRIIDPRQFIFSATFDL